MPGFSGLGGRQGPLGPYGGTLWWDPMQGFSGFGGGRDPLVGPYGGTLWWDPMVGNTVWGPRAGIML